MKYAWFSLFIVQLFAACSSNYGIGKARAYVREKIAGTIPVDDNGQPLSSGVSEEHLLFVETDPAQAAPAFATVWINGKPYSVQPVKMNPAGQVIGKTAKGEGVSVSAKEGRTLWQLVLTPKQESLAARPSLLKKVAEKKIVLTGTWREKDFVYAFDKEERLEPLSFQ